LLDFKYNIGYGVEMNKFNIVIIALVFSTIFINNSYGQIENIETKLEWGDLLQNISSKLESPESYITKVTTNLAAGTTIYDLSLYMIGMVVYAIFIWHFYRFISKREIIPIKFNRDESKTKKSVKIATYAASHAFLFPLIISVWFLVYAFFMFILSKEMPTGVIFLIAITVIGATRITSYYKEDLAKDLGKLLPFALLGVFLTSSSLYADTSNFFSLEDLQKRLSELPLFLSKGIEFVIIISSIEVLLRSIFVIKRKFIPAAEEKLEEKIEAQIDEKIKIKVEKVEKKQEALEEQIEKESEKIEKEIEDKTEKIEEKIVNNKVDEKVNKTNQKTNRT